ncbi:phosphatidylglycerophosphatase A [Amaricoccus sp.]|uniref:phosphatidylglycerophosphatase A family protein n=1 Tax=Amaricoccus sp. TaxID=1872485 RepID=UPI001B3F42CA|nr:phosphatidylglycerophosphatase A [Amaricoccus sp.]MBP7000742.1 phosphatidylglycerophosphatase A [Amaricoccus sp.]
MRLARAICTFGYVGLIPGPAGTWGAAAAVPAGWILHGLGGFPLLALATIALYPIGYWATRVEVVDEHDLDPGYVVVDEVVGQWIALWPLSLGLWHMGAPAWLFPWPGWVGAFLLFRLFDILKLGPVGWADRKKGPMGVMLDDAIAGVMAAVVVSVAAAVAHGWLM